MSQLPSRYIRHAVVKGIGGFPKLDVPYWGPHNKDYSIWGSILGFLYFGKLPIGPGVFKASRDMGQNKGPKLLFDNCPTAGKRSSEQHGRGLRQCGTASPCHSPLRNEGIQQVGAPFWEFLL